MKAFALKNLALPVLAAFAFAAFAPAPASAATAASTVTSVNMRAGPSANYPVVARLPSRAPLRLYGCNAGVTWCDVNWDGERGWVAASYVRIAYRGSYTVVSPAVAPVVGVAVVGFSHAYWNAHYVGRPWYGHWGRHHHYGPSRVAAGGCRNGVCGGVVAGPRGVAAGHCGKRHCSGTVVRRGPYGGVRAAHGGFRRR